MHPTSQSHRLWSAIEDIPRAQTVLAEWRERLGSDFESVQTLLRPSDQHAASSPRLAQDILVHRLDLKALAREISDALGITSSFEEFPGLPFAWRIGAIDSATNASTLVHLVIPPESEDLRHTIQEVVAGQKSAGMIIAPTRRRVRPSFEAFIKANSGYFVGLSNVLKARSHDRWTVNHDATESIREFVASARKPSDGGVSQRTHDMSLVLLELGAVNSDKCRPLEDIAARAFSGNADVASLKGLMRQMKDRNFVESRLGPGGGYWLTAKGLEQAKRLKSA